MGTALAWMLLVLGAVIAVYGLANLGRDEEESDPAQYLRPREEVFNMQWSPPADQEAQGARLMQEYRVAADGKDLKDCSICHR